MSSLLLNNLRIASLSAAGRRRRGGTVSSLLVVSALVIIAAAALAVDVGLMAHSRVQLKNGSKGAALAGAPHLADRSVLYPHLWEPSVRGEQGEGDPLAEMRMIEARRAAIETARENTAMGQRIVLEREDILIGEVKEPLDVGGEMTVRQGQTLAASGSGRPAGRINSIEVSARRLEERGNPVSLWIGQLLGVPGMDVTAVSRATIDQRVAGFRPVDHVLVPVAPLVILIQGDGQGWWEQAMQPAGKNSDLYGVEEPSGLVTLGGDRIPEVVVKLMRPKQGKKEEGQKNEGQINEEKENDEEEEKANGWVVSLMAPRSGWDVVRQFRYGLDEQDLAGLGGVLYLGGGSAGGLVLPEDEEIARDPSEARPALLSAEGKLRVFPLGRKVETADGPGIVIEALAAGRIVQVSSAGDEGISMRIQPGILLTPTAIIERGADECLYVGKVMVTK